MARRHRAVCEKLKRKPWRSYVANLWALKEPITVAVICRIGYDVEVILMTQ